MHTERIVRERERKELTGIPTSSWYDLVDDGLAPPSVKLGKVAAGWPVSEIAALNAARIAGKSESDIRTLVTRLIAARANAFDKFEAA